MHQTDHQGTVGIHLHIGHDEPARQAWADDACLAIGPAGAWQGAETFADRP